MTDQEIDKWVEEHLKCPSGEEVLRVNYDELTREILKWGKNIAKMFYRLGKEDERKVNMLTGPLW
jgi:hypothetical protein